MNTLRAVVADDEPVIRADLVRLLSELPDLRVVGEARNGLEAVDLVEAERPDALLLDVRMPGLDGFGVVDELDPDTAPAIVFVTAFDQYAIRAFDAHAVDYLLKPFDPSRLAIAVDRVRVRLAGSRAEALARTRSALAASRGGASDVPLERIAARGVGRTMLIDVSQITWIEAADNYVRLHTTEGVHLSRRTLRDLERQLDSRRFARIHRSMIVALDRVRELRPLGDGDHELRLHDGTRLVLTRSHREDFLGRFGGIA
jgi:two-component system LytT family response regulator